MIGSGFFFSFIIGRMASVMSKLDSVRNARKERLEGVTTFLKDVDLPRPLSKRCGQVTWVACLHPGRTHHNLHAHTTENT